MGCGEGKRRNRAQDEPGNRTLSGRGCRSTSPRTLKQKKQAAPVNKSLTNQTLGTACEWKPTHDGECNEPSSNVRNEPWYSFQAERLWHLSGLRLFRHKEEGIPEKRNRIYRSKKRRCSICGAHRVLTQQRPQRKPSPGWRCIRPLHKRPKRAGGRLPTEKRGQLNLQGRGEHGKDCEQLPGYRSPSLFHQHAISSFRRRQYPVRTTVLSCLQESSAFLQKYKYRFITEEHMERKYDPIPKTEEDESATDHPDMPVVITVDDYYDLLMEQQEQM